MFINGILFLIIIISIAILSGVQTKLIESYNRRQKELSADISAINDDDMYTDDKNIGKNKLEPEFYNDCEEIHTKFVERVDKDTYIRNKINEINKLPDMFGGAIKTKERKELTEDHDYKLKKGQSISKNWSDINREWNALRKENIDKVKKDDNAKSLNCFNTSKIDSYKENN